MNWVKFNYGKFRKRLKINRYLKNEVTGIELIQDFKSDSDFLDGDRRVKQLEKFRSEAEFIELDQQRVLNFLVQSGDEEYSRRNQKNVASNTYTLKIKPITLFEVLEGEDDDISTDDLKEIIQDSIINGDIKIHSESPDWKFWGFQYQGTVFDYALFPERRPADIRNPGNLRSVSKHLFWLLEAINEGMFVDEIEKEIRRELKGGRFK